MICNGGEAKQDSSLFVYFFVMLLPIAGQGLLIPEFLDYIQRRSTVGTVLLDERSARRRDLHWTTQTRTADKHLCPRRDSNPQSQHASGRRARA
jgi:hypothetical protein